MTSSKPKKTQQKNSGGSFLLQGSILAAASIISRIIGLAYRIPLTNILGKTGSDYYSTAYEAYNIVLIISSFSLPLAVSKLVSERVAKGQRKNAWRVVRGALLFALISGGAAALLLFFGADFFTGTLLKTPMAALALRILAPTVLVVAVVGVLRGFFQGLGSMVPSALSQIAEQIINAIVSVFAAWMLFSRGTRLGELLGNSEMGASYAAGGGTLGTLCGALTALAFMGFLFLAYRGIYTEKAAADRDLKRESSADIARALFVVILPVLLSTTLYNAVNFLDQFLYKNITVLQGIDPDLISRWWGTYTGEVVVIQNIPLGIASAIGASAVPSLTAAFHGKDRAKTAGQISSALRFIMMIAAPCAFGIFALAGPILLLLYHDADPVAIGLMRTSLVLVPVFTVSTLTNSLLQGIDKMRLPVIHAAVSLVVQAGVLILCMSVFHMGIYAVPVANICYGALMCVQNELALVRYGRVRLDRVSIYLTPLLAAGAMGGFVWIFNWLLRKASVPAAVSTLLSIAAGAVVYVCMLLVTGALTEQDLKRIPMGEKLLPLIRHFSFSGRSGGLHGE